ncbi:hypothetical protein BGZ65_001363 [Modicella reniformis]|uniref:Uncharacterized protein n=1 Tax=Modicella reniformis TaxID=1440133 RepID=A0A9P6SN09_9FUNG|nr:hypothetical protein BGZ65_001363 [Modicella reniformis]
MPLTQQLQIALIEIKDLAQTNKSLAIANQELEDAREQAANDQAKTARQLSLVSGQLEYVEQQLYDLNNKENEHDPRNSELLRKERAMREKLQEREDASRLQIETLKDELEEVQRSERALQQKLLTVQNKHDNIAKHYEYLKRQQQELELARESKEALSWLKETTDRLSPPPGSSGQAIQQEQASQESTAISIHGSSPSSSPPYSFIDPPLAAQNQLISLIKELATTNSTLRSELKEYKDLLQDTRNEMLSIQAQLEYHEQGHGCENCYEGRMDDDDSYLSKSAWSTLDIPSASGLDAASHIGTLGSIPGSPPLYSTTSRNSSRNPHHYPSHLGGVRGNVFGELERLYSQSNNNSTPKRQGKGRSSKKSKRRMSKGLLSTSDALAQLSYGATMSTSTSTFEVRRESASMITPLRSPLNPTSSNLGHSHRNNKSSPTSNTSRKRRSVDRDMLYSGSDSDERDKSATHSSDTGDSEGDMEEPGIIFRLAEPDKPTITDITGHDDMLPEDENTPTPKSSLDPDSRDRSNKRNNSISLLSAELQKATRSETLIDHGMEKDFKEMQDEELHPLEQKRSSSFVESDVILEGEVLDLTATSWNKDKDARNQHEKSMSDHGPSSERQRRRLSLPLQQGSSPSSLTPKKGRRPSSIYSIRRPRLRMDPCIYTGHAASSSVGGLLELPKYKSAELLEQIIAEQRQQMMEAWRDGVVAASVTQQQPTHSATASGEQRKDPDNMSIRSKASRRRTRGASTVDAAGNEEERDKLMNRMDLPTGILPSKDSKDHVETENEATPKLDNSTTLTDSVQVQTSKPSPEEEEEEEQDEESRKDKKRKSIRSTRSARSSILRPSLGRARDRRFPSEASTASEVFSDRRHNLGQSPYQLLHTLTTDLLERLNRSDTLELNRRLRRTFDMQDLSKMSNSVIENVLTDVGNLGERFRWLEAQVADPIDELLERRSGSAPLVGESGTGSELGNQDEIQSEFSHDDEDKYASWAFSVTEFFPLKHTIQEMLSEIGKLRVTINELQLSYVQKVEQDRIRAEKDFLQNPENENDVDYRIMDPRSDHSTERSARPRILTSASTGVSGFLNKLKAFGSNNNQSSHRNPKSQEVVQKPAVAVASSEGLDKSKMSKVSARSTTSNNAWASGMSSTGTLLTQGSRISASTSLAAAVASVSLARSNTIHVAEGQVIVPTTTTMATATAPTAITRTKATNTTRFSPDVKQGLVLSNSPHTASPTPTFAPSIMSQSRSLDTRLSEETAVPSKSSPGQSLIHTSFQSHMNTSEDEKAPHHLSSVSERPEHDSDNAVDTLKTAKQDRRSLTLNKATRSIDISSTRTGSLAFVTKQDVFQEHWTTSTPSSFSATTSIVPSRATNERKATGDNTAAAAAAGAGGGGGGKVVVGFMDPPHKGGLSLATSDAMSTVASRLVSKPSLVTQSALTVAVPSTSTVSSPIDTTLRHDTSFNNEFTQSRLRSAVGARVEDDVGDSTQECSSQARTSRGDSLTVLRSEAQASSILGSFLQSRSQSPARSHSPIGSLAVQRSGLKSDVKGKGLASDSQPSIHGVKTNLEIMTSDFGDEHEAATGYQADYSTETATPQDADFASMEGRLSATTSFSQQQKMTPSRSETLLGPAAAPTTSISQRTAVTSTAVAYVVATPGAYGHDEEGSRQRKAVFDRKLIKASQERILAGAQQNKAFVPQASPRRGRALSVDSAQSSEAFKSNEFLDLWRAGADASRDIWRGLIKKVDGRDP